MGKGMDVGGGKGTRVSCSTVDSCTPGTRCLEQGEIVEEGSTTRRSYKFYKTFTKSIEKLKTKISNCKLFSFICFNY